MTTLAFAPLADPCQATPSTGIAIYRQYDSFSGGTRLALAMPGDALAERAALPAGFEPATYGLEDRGVSDTEKQGLNASFSEGLSGQKQASFCEVKNALSRFIAFIVFGGQSPRFTEGRVA